MSFESIIDITEKVLSLASFITSIVFNNPFGVGTVFNELVNDI